MVGEGGWTAHVYFGLISDSVREKMFPSVMAHTIDNDHSFRCIWTTVLCTDGNLRDVAYTSILKRARRNSYLKHEYSFVIFPVSYIISNSFVFFMHYPTTHMYTAVIRHVTPYCIILCHLYRI